MNELVVNLWAIYDADTGLVYALSGRAYNLGGEDDQKLRVLQQLARADYITAKRYQVPSRFTVSFTDGSTQEGATLLNTVADPSANLFEEMFTNIEAELPPVMQIVGTEMQEIKLLLPEDPLCVITTLYEDEHGSVTPIITDSDREWIREQECIRGR